MCCVCCREKLFCQSLAKLKEDVVKANSLVREANFLVQEMCKPVEFSVTLQIPASNLSPNRRVTMLPTCKQCTDSHTSEIVPQSVINEDLEYNENKTNHIKFGRFKYLIIQIYTVSQEMSLLCLAVTLTYVNQF